MAFIIENGTAGSIEIEDLGITLAIGEISDLSTRTQPQEVALSMQTGEELHTLITAGDVIVKDPLDGVTDLSVADAITSLQSINDPHFRVGAGARLNDISDVNVPSPSDGQVMSYIGVKSEWQPQTAAGGSTIAVEDEGVAVPNSPFSVFDFVGDGVIASDAGGGTVTITIPGQVSGEIPFFNQDTTQDNIALTVGNEIPFFNQDTTPDNIALV